MGLFESIAGIGGMFLQNEWSKSSAQKQRHWSENMSNTAHQRQVADLKKAGLNPVLSATGTGASVPNVAQAQIPPAGNILNQAVSNAIAAKTARANVKNINAQENLNVANSSNVKLDNQLEQEFQTWLNLPQNKKMKEGMFAGMASKRGNVRGEFGIPSKALYDVFNEINRMLKNKKSSMEIQYMLREYQKTGKLPNLTEEKKERNKAVIEATKPRRGTTKY